MALSDSLYAFVCPNRSKLWRFTYWTMTRSCCRQVAIRGLSSRLRGIAAGEPSWHCSRAGTGALSWCRFRGHQDTEGFGTAR